MCIFPYSPFFSIASWVQANNFDINIAIAAFLLVCFQNSPEFERGILRLEIYPNGWTYGKAPTGGKPAIVFRGTVVGLHGMMAARGHDVSNHGTDDVDMLTVSVCT